MLLGNIQKERKETGQLNKMYNYISLDTVTKASLNPRSSVKTWDEARGLAS